MKLSIKKILPRSLLGRSLLILMTPIFLIQVITTYIFFDRHWDKVTGRLAFAVAGEVAMIVSDVENASDGDEIEAISQKAVKALDFLVSFDDGAALSKKRDDRNTMVGKALSESLSYKISQPFRISIDIEEKWVEVSIALQNGVLRITMPQRRLFSSSGYIFLLWMIAISITLLAIAILFMRNQIRPIRRLAIVAERFGRGQDAPASFKPEGAREIRQAARSFLDMRDRIRRQIQQRTAMLAGISHDLRTPLTRMKLQTEMLGDTPDAAELKSDIAEMEKMVNAYLDFVRGEGDEKTEAISLNDLISRIIINTRRIGIDINEKDIPEIMLTVRPVAFERCLMNIINNATKYAHHIEISVENTENELLLHIDDDGPGIPEDALGDVFRPFFRVDESRNLETGGIGLGLPIAQDIILSHGGHIELGRSPLGGLRATIIMAK